MHLKPLLVLAGLWASAAHGDEQRVKTALEHRACLLYATETANRLGFLAEKYMTNPGTTTNIRANFRVVDTKFQRLMTSIHEAFTRHMGEKVGNRDEFMAKRSALRKDFVEFSRRSLETISLGEKFIRSVAEIEGEFVDLNQKVDSVARMNCMPETKETLGQIRSHSVGAETSAAKMRMVIERKIGALPKYLSFTEETAARSLMKSFADSTAADFAGLSKELENGFLSFALNDDIEIWRVESMTFSGAARGYWDRYYAYDKALAQLAADIEVGNGLLRKLDGSSLDAATKSELRRKVEAHIALMNGTQSRYKEAGWASRHEYQKKLAAKVATRKTWTSQSCDQKLVGLSRQLAGVTTYEQYRSEEPRFVDFMKDCIYKE